MNDLARKSELLKKAVVVHEYDEGGWERVYRAVSVVDIETSETVDYAPVVHGEWIECASYDEDGYYDVEYKCSKCGRFEYRKEPYCHCGAKMNEEN